MKFVGYFALVFILFKVIVQQIVDIVHVKNESVYT